MQEKYNIYRDFTIEDFLLDDDFLNWRKLPTIEKDLFWKEFLVKYPQKEEDIEEAKAMFLKLKFKQDLPDAAGVSRVWNRIQNEKLIKPESFRLSNFASKNIWWAAAAIILMIGSGLWFWNENAYTTVYTENGHTKNVTLPDGTKVVLSENSILKYKNKWDNASAREVWLEGIGSFDVVHINKAGTPIKLSDKFEVHLKNMNIEVLGTVFTVISRKHEEQVVLKSGSVKVTGKGADSSIFLKPGEIVEYNETKKAVCKVAVTSSVPLNTLPKTTTVFKEDKPLELNNTSLSDLSKLIEDAYGYKIVVTDTTLLNKRFSGTISSKNEDILFKALESMFSNDKVIIKDQTITISQH